MDYADFIALEAEARLVITDSGGVQEETSVLGVPCLTYRDNDRAAGHGRAGHEHAGRASIRRRCARPRRRRWRAEPPERPAADPALGRRGRAPRGRCGRILPRLMTEGARKVAIVPA